MTERDNKPVDLVIFDCDGVLVDSELLAAEVLAREVSVEGLPLTADECLARYTGISMKSVLALIEAERGRALPPDFEARVRAGDFAAFAASLQPVAGVREMLQALPHRRCVASSGWPDKMRFTLGRTGLLPLLAPHLFSASMVAHGKPAPDLFLHAARMMHADPAACVVVEDSVAGIIAARAAGMRVLGFAGASHCGDGYRAMLEGAGASIVFSRMDQLVELLKQVR
ncbi:MAG: HAD-IA family hydrolase [Rhodospirillales bacterium]